MGFGGDLGVLVDFGCFLVLGLDWAFLEILGFERALDFEGFEVGK